MRLKKPPVLSSRVNRASAASRAKSSTSFDWSIVTNLNSETGALVLGSRLSTGGSVGASGGGISGGVVSGAWSILILTLLSGVVGAGVGVGVGAGVVGTAGVGAVGAGGAAGAGASAAGGGDVTGVVLLFPLSSATVALVSVVPLRPSLLSRASKSAHSLSVSGSASASG